MADTWKRWVEAFWFLRGIAAAMTLAVLIPKFTDLSRFEFLRAFHALVVRWNDVAAWIGGLIGLIPFLPELDAEVVNCIIFGLSIGLPGGIVMAIHMWRRATPLFLRVGHSLLWPPAYFLMTAMIYYLMILGNGFGISGISDAILICTSILIAAMFGYALVVLKGYAKGLVFVVTFVLSMQVLYWLNTPWLTNQINAAVEETMRDDR